MKNNLVAEQPAILSAMEQAWIELQNHELNLTPEQVFQQGWISRGFFELERIDALKTE